MLEIKDVKKHYAGAGEVVRAVDGATLSLKEGEFVAIFGPSGSGKTTFLLLAAGLLSPDAGEVSFNEKDLSSLSKDEVLDYRREDVGFVFQSFHLLYGLSALENVAIASLIADVRWRDAKEEALSLLKLVGLHDRVKHRAGKLSGGEMQRVAIARALIGKPSLILADEPTGNLDTKRGEEALNLLAGLSEKRGAAVLLVTHDIRAADHAVKIKEMRDGELYDYDPRTSKQG